MFVCTWLGSNFKLISSQYDAFNHLRALAKKINNANVQWTLFRLSFGVRWHNLTRFYPRLRELSEGVLLRHCYQRRHQRDIKQSLLWPESYSSNMRLLVYSVAFLCNNSAASLTLPNTGDILKFPCAAVRVFNMSHFAHPSQVTSYSNYKLVKLQKI